MAQIHSDILLIGEELSGIIAASLLSQKGLRTIHIPKAKNEFPKNIELPGIWHGYEDSVQKFIIDQLELRSDINRLFDKTLPYSFIEDKKSCFYLSPNKDLLREELFREFKDEANNWLSALENIEPNYIENSQLEASKEEINNNFLRFLNKFFNTKKNNSIIVENNNLSFLKKSKLNKLLKIGYFLSNTDKNALPSELCILPLKYGISLPKNNKKSSLEELKSVFLASLARHGSLSLVNANIGDFTIHKKGIKNVKLANSEDSYNTKFVINGSTCPLLDTEKYEHEDLNSFSIVIKTSINKKALSLAFTRLGFFYEENPQILACYELHDLEINKNLEKNILEKKNLTLVVIPLVKEAQNNLESFAKKILYRHFSHGLTDLEKDFYKQNTINSQRQSISTELKNYFRASILNAPNLGISGHFATGLALYKMIAKKAGLKL